MLKDANAIVQNYENLLHTVSTYQLRKKATLTIASIPVMAQYDITGLLADFQNLHPEIKLQIEETETTHLATVVPPKHPLSKKKQVSVSELRNENLLLLSKSTLHYDKITEICRQRGFEPRVIYTGTHMDNILDLVSKNHGISLLMQHAVEYRISPTSRSGDHFSQGRVHQCHRTRL